MVANNLFGHEYTNSLVLLFLFFIRAFVASPCFNFPHPKPTNPLQSNNRPQT
ncbi:hypothetical protein C943_01902 [Mariniradius saccharolyticus AK6]|uniref:Uncharacterized protein n=1 Tax=Mariniradius saccharolyticus AK6 TaxID=1239962 RepID=M7Y329_9BACT|nr:hypothetical protein C943_01902 [Mariniradius saccharolyticus AK6]